MVILALSTLETGQPFSALRAASSKAWALAPGDAVLDLGCGTGLLGLMLGKIAGSMIGVDASIKMIEQAEKHGVYDRFHTVNLLDALRETDASQYHVIAALDVFIYVGDLAQAIARCLRERPG